MHAVPFRGSGMPDPYVGRGGEASFEQQRRNRIHISHDLKLEKFGFHGAQIDHAHRIESRHDARAFARIENELMAALLVTV